MGWLLAAASALLAYVFLSEFVSSRQNEARFINAIFIALGVFGCLLGYLISRSVRGAFWPVAIIGLIGAVLIVLLGKEPSTLARVVIPSCVLIHPAYSILRLTRVLPPPHS